MDDLLGAEAEHKSVLVQLLYTAKAFGIHLACHKGERGLQLTWVGVKIEVRPEEAIVLSMPSRRK